MPAYRLQVLLEMRIRAEQEAQNRLTEERMRLSKANGLLQQLLAERQVKFELRSERHKVYTRHMQSQSFSARQVVAEHQVLQQMAHEIRAMDDLVDQQEQAVKAQGAEVQRARELHLEKAKELKALERHKEQWLIEYKREIANRESQGLGSAPSAKSWTGGVREKLVFLRELASQAVRFNDAKGPDSSEISGLDITPDNLRRSEAELLPEEPGPPFEPDIAEALRRLRDLKRQVPAVAAQIDEVIALLTGPEPPDSEAGAMRLPVPPDQPSDEDQQPPWMSDTDSPEAPAAQG